MLSQVLTETRIEVHIRVRECRTHFRNYGVTLICFVYYYDMKYTITVQHCLYNFSI